MGGVALVALVAIAPIVVLMLTSFVKISVVLALLRNELGAPEAPSGLVVMGVALVLTFFVMAPVAVDVVRAAAATGSGPSAPGGGEAPAGPGGAAKGVKLEVEAAVRQLVPEQYRQEVDAAVRAVGPLRAFLAKHAGERDRETFAAVARRMGR